MYQSALHFFWQKKQQSIQINVRVKVSCLLQKLNNCGERTGPKGLTFLTYDLKLNNCSANISRKSRQELFVLVQDQNMFRCMEE